MTPELIVATLLPLRVELNQFGIRRLAVFGSAARGEASAESDLDFLVEFEGPATFDAYMGLKELLAEAFRREIDLVTLRALKPRLRDQILAEAIQVA